MSLDDHHVRQARSLKHLIDLRHIQVLERTVIHQRQLLPRHHDLIDSAYVPPSAKRLRQPAFGRPMLLYSIGGDQSEHLVVEERFGDLIGFGLGTNRLVADHVDGVSERALSDRRSARTAQHRRNFGAGLGVAEHGRLVFDVPALHLQRPL